MSAPPNSKIWMHKNLFNYTLCKFQDINILVDPLSCVEMLLHASKNMLSAFSHTSELKAYFNFSKTFTRRFRRSYTQETLRFYIKSPQTHLSFFTTVLIKVFDLVFTERCQASTFTIITIRKRFYDFSLNS